MNTTDAKALGTMGLTHTRHAFPSTHHMHWGGGGSLFPWSFNVICAQCESASSLHGECSPSRHSVLVRPKSSLKSMKDWLGRVKGCDFNQGGSWKGFLCK